MMCIVADVIGEFKFEQLLDSFVKKLEAVCA